jgi:hypothetical protein
LAVGELALSLALLGGSGLLIRSFLRLQDVDAGFRADGVLAMRVSLPEQKYSKPEQTRAFYRELLDRVRQLPGVDAAGAATGCPLTGTGWSGTLPAAEVSGPHHFSPNSPPAQPARSDDQCRSLRYGQGRIVLGCLFRSGAEACRSPGLCASSVAAGRF